MSHRYPLRIALTAGITMTITGALIGTSYGNVYPTNLAQTANSFNPSAAESVTLSYLLNEDATNVSIDILDNTTSVVKTLSGPLTKGIQTVVWDGTDNSNMLLPDGNYSFRVNTTGDAKSVWTLISDDSTLLNNFFTPRGVAVNKNPDSPYYGRIYVTEAANGTTTAAGRAMSDGVYMLNADITDTGIAGGTGPHTGGVTWGAGSNTSPYKIEVGPDDSVYITDWSDGHSGLWRADPNMSSAIEALDNSAQSATGLNATHGSISDVVITGTGASRTIYTSDEDFVPPGGSTGSILRYDIGETTTFTGAPSGYAYIDGTGSDTQVNRIQNMQDSIARDSNGNFWMSQVRSTVPSATDTLPSLIQIDGTTGTVLWASVPDMAATTANDLLRGTQGIAFDPGTGLLALATNQSGGTIILFDTASKTIIDQFNFVGTTNTDVGFDNAGNLYAVNRSAERLRIWSPPNTLGFVANEFTTESLGPLGMIAISSAPGGIDGDYNDDGTVDAADYIVWRKNAGTTNTLPNDPNGGEIGAAQYNTWVANFGDSNQGGGANGAAAAPEPCTWVLAMISLAFYCASSRRRTRV